MGRVVKLPARTVMQIHLLAIGRRMPAWVEAGFGEYVSRFPAGCRLRLHEIPAGRRVKGAPIDRIVREEGARLLAAVPANARIIALDRAGRALSTDELAAELKAQMARGEDWALLIGGPEGLSSDCLERAHARWSLSRLTLAHPLVRVVVAEQLYRAWSILNNLPYHR